MDQWMVFQIGVHSIHPSCTYFTADKKASHASADEDKLLIQLIIGDALVKPTTVLGDYPASLPPGVPSCPSALMYFICPSLYLASLMPACNIDCLHIRLRSAKWAVIK